MGDVDLAPGELVAGQLVPRPALDPLRETLRAGSEALLALGFFDAVAVGRESDTASALRAAAKLRFDLFDVRGELVPATFVNLIEAPGGGTIVLARLGHAHAEVSASLVPTPRAEHSENRPSAEERDVQE